MAHFFDTAILGVVALIVVLVYVSGIGSRPKGYPPGPATLPIIGNLHQMPKTRVHIQFQKWAAQYGALNQNRPIFSLVLGSQVIIVLSSDVAVKDLLDKRSAIYSSRPDLFLGQTIASGGLRFSLMPYGDTWRMMRRCIHSILNIRTAKSYVPYQDLENKQMLAELLEQPDAFINHLQRYADSLTTQMVFGFRTVDKDEEHLKEMFQNFSVFNEVCSSITAGLLDVFPILRYLPDFMVPIKKRARQSHIREKNFYLNGWMKTKQQVKDGTAKPSFCVGLMKAQELDKFNDDLAGYTTGVLHEGGSDTSAATLTTFIQTMVLHPEVQLRAREELDRVCGDRLPIMEDEENLPYVRACVKEVLRCYPIVTTGLPHAVVKDDVYQGYYIPKGATVILNIWTINRDPSRYKSPRVYDPTRFLGDTTTAAESAMSPDVSKRDHFTFGAGRRICPGMHVADRTLFLSISRLLWGFDFSKAKRLTTGVDGREVWEEVTPDQDDVVDGLLAHPVPFPARITPRSERHAEIIKRAWEDCQESLDEKGQWKTLPEGMLSAGYTPSVDLVY
ncbi:Fumitremorgin C synthase [Cytospora mali]|uniref:Fumitremorgin C synthase n=1 Tax=Cytospora mali TaxID=578113 RepID=A0A194V887_CYTMA|nr:Fumitremorgin C synthase [Valsa mali var. pyri (nom. inval.)]